MDKNRREKMNMRLAEKIFNERKRLGLSQEQFAEQMEVSRQAVSKWESGQSMPDLDKLVLMSRILGVSTDYLLKEEDVDSFSKGAAKEAEYTGHSSTFWDTSSGQVETVRKLKEEEIKEYRAACFKASKRTSFGVFLCIFGGVLVNAVEMYEYPKGIDTGLSAVPMLICIAVAVGFFVFSGIQMKKYVFLKMQPFLLPEKEKTRLAEEYDGFYKIFVSRIIMGVILCILGVIVYIVCNAFGEVSFKINGMTTWDYISTMELLLIIAIAVPIFVSAGMRKEYYDVLMQKNGFSEIRKKERSENMDVMMVVAGIYWCIITAVFLAYNFTTGNWGKSWIVWPVAGCVFSAISIAITFVKSNKKDRL